MNFMKKLKYGLISCTLSLLVVIPASPVSAFNSPTLENLPMTKIEISSLQNELQEIENKYEGVTLDLLPKKSSDLEIAYEFKSVEELDQFIENFKDGYLQNGKEVNYEISLDKINSSRIADVDTVKWWAPNSKWPFNGLACWKNVTYSYDYNWKKGKPYFTSNNIKISSYTSGINGTSWHQTGKAVNLATKYSSNDTAKSTVNGYFLCGVSINGAPIGLTVNDSWTSSLTLVSK